MTDAARRAEWERLRAERDELRASLSRALASLDERARDPFRLKQIVRRHPYLTAGLAAGAGAVLVSLLVGRDADRPEGETSSTKHGGSHIADALRDMAVKVAAPWVTRLVAKHFGEDVEEHAESTNGSAG